jgi:hypothetical protein
VLFDQPGLLGTELTIEKIIQPAKRLFTGLPVHELQSASFDIAALGTGISFLQQSAQRRIHPASLSGGLGVYQFFRVAVHLGTALGTAQPGHWRESPRQLSGMFSRP